MVVCPLLSCPRGPQHTSQAFERCCTGCACAGCLTQRRCGMTQERLAQMGMNPQEIKDKHEAVKSPAVVVKEPVVVKEE